MNRRYRAPALFYAGLFLVWGIYEMAVLPALGLSDRVSFAVSECIKCAVWVPPALLLLRRTPEPFVKQLFQWRINWWPYLGAAALLVVYHVVSCFVRTHTLAIVPEFYPETITLSLMVGFSEEVVFRGYLLNATIDEKSPWKAILINAAMFLLIHFPIWIRTGVLAMYLLRLVFMQIVMLSLLFTWGFWKSRSILPAVLLHTVWDIAVFALVG